MNMGFGLAIILLATLPGGSDAPKFLRGEVVRVEREGLVVRCLESGPSVQSRMRRSGGGGNVAPSARESEVSGRVFVVGYPNQKGMADGDVVEGEVVEQGVVRVGVETFHCWRWCSAAVDEHATVSGKPSSSQLTDRLKTGFSPSTKPKPVRRGP